MSTVLEEYIISSKTGEAGVSGWGPQDETMGLARRFLFAVISNSAQMNMSLCCKNIFCIFYLPFPSGRVETDIAEL